MEVVTNCDEFTEKQAVTCPVCGVEIEEEGQCCSERCLSDFALWEELRSGVLKSDSVLRKIENDRLIKVISLGHNQAFPKYPPLVVTGRWLYGVWMVGNDYRNPTKFYGAYPRGLLKRYDAMFGWCKEVLHIFSGSMPKDKKYVRFDMVQKADVRGDVHELSQHFEADRFDICFADPPYNSEIAENKYGTPMIKRLTVIKEVNKVLAPGGLLVWLDTTFPQFRKKEFDLIGTVGLIRSTNHLVRGIFIFRKKRA